MLVSVDLTPQAFQKAIEKRPRLARVLTQMVSKHVRNRLERIDKGEKNWQRLAWILERSLPQEFGQVSKRGDGQVSDALVVGLANEVLARAAALLARPSQDALPEPKQAPKQAIVDVEEVNGEDKPH